MEVEPFGFEMDDPAPRMVFVGTKEEVLHVLTNTIEGLSDAEWLDFALKEHQRRGLGNY